ncbi:hypothetical protein TWF730_003601 [Orbilia blumenaviensis]|uniref:CBM1 domain-containing protein n=1 Tax=Orbilia blumenaviensis TaxID=1796055 RepID=A0AAV9U2W5_9PEZI
MAIKLVVIIGATLQVVAAQMVTPAPSQTLWGQCGGVGWTGPTTCAPYTGEVLLQVMCTTYNPYYAQCIPDYRPTTSLPPTTTPITTIRDCMPMLSCTTSS